MKCVICKHGETKPGRATVTLQRGETTVIFKGVPADVCQSCGEYYLTDSIAGQLLEQTEAAAKRGAEVEILRFAA